TIGDTEDAGCHGGKSGSQAGTDCVYGSHRLPRFPGSGASEAYPQGRGGGLVAIEAPKVTVNGTIRADGGREGDASEGGAGGSIRIQSPWIAGNGKLQANSEWQAGGRVALRGGRISEKLQASAEGAG
ncbi:MAG: hypothetical protein ABEK42_10865, partial [Thiohalorhabdaceae bacterium]